MTDPRELRLRAELVAAGARLARLGLVRGGEGNLSARLGSGHVLISPRGADKGRLSMPSLVRRALAGGGGDEASTEAVVHLAVYRRCPEVGALVHAHPGAVLALDALGGVPEPAALLEGPVVVPRIVRVPPLAPGGEALAAACAEALRGAPVAVLSAHGVLAAGRDAAEAVFRVEVTELLASVALAAKTGAGA